MLSAVAFVGFPSKTEFFSFHAFWYNGLLSRRTFETCWINSLQAGDEALPSDGDTQLSFTPTLLITSVPSPLHLYSRAHTHTHTHKLTYVYTEAPAPGVKLGISPKRDQIPGSGSWAVACGAAKGEWPDRPKRRRT